MVHLSPIVPCVTFIRAVAFGRLRVRYVVHTIVGYLHPWRRFWSPSERQLRFLRCLLSQVRLSLLPVRTRLPVQSSITGNQIQYSATIAQHYFFFAALQHVAMVQPVLGHFFPALLPLSLQSSTEQTPDVSHVSSSSSRQQRDCVQPSGPKVSHNFSATSVYRVCPLIDNS